MYVGAVVADEILGMSSVAVVKSEVTLVGELESEIMLIGLRSAAAIRYAVARGLDVALGADV